MSDKYGNIYSVYILKFPDGKRYVGCTRQNPHKRWRCGQGYRHTKRLYEAICNAGWDNIEKIIVETNISMEYARKKEIELISQYKTQDHEYGYNTKNGGQVFEEHSQEFLDSLHERMVGNRYCVGRKLRDSHLEALRKANVGHHRPTPNKGKHIHTEEAKKHFSELAKARWQNEEYRKRQLSVLRDLSGKNNPMYGKHHSDKTKRKISEKNSGRKLNEEARRKLSEASVTARKVYQLDLYGNIMSEFRSCVEAARKVNGNGSNISFACRNQGRTYKGYRWRYAEEID